MCCAKVIDIPMPAKYDGEESSLKIIKIIVPFLKNKNNSYSRIVYNYFIRDFSIASIE